MQSKHRKMVSVCLWSNKQTNKQHCQQWLHRQWISMGVELILLQNIRYLFTESKTLGTDHKLFSLTEACHWVRKTASPVSGAEKGSSGRTREEPRSSRSGSRFSIFPSMLATLKIELWVQCLLRSIRERHHYEKEKERWKQCSSGMKISNVKTFSVPFNFQEPTAGQEGQSIAGGSRGSSKG